MWNSVKKCKICMWEFEDERPNGSLEYRKNILQVCSTHLFDELVTWSDINCEEPLPFCPYCLANIEQMSSMNDGYNLIRNTVKNVASTFIMDSLRNRKLMKSKRQLFLDTKPIIKLEPQIIAQFNCVICYAIYLNEPLVENALSIENKRNIWKVFKQYDMIPAFLRNEVNFEWKTLPLLNFEPFCPKCSMIVTRVVKLDEKLNKAMSDMNRFIDSFSLGCFKRQKYQNDKAIEENNKNTECVTLDEASDIETGFLDGQEVTQSSADTTIACGDHPLELNSTGLENYEKETSNSVPIGVSKIAMHKDLHSNSPAKNATRILKISDSQEPRACSSRNPEPFSTKTSEHHDPENGRSFSTKEGNTDNVVVTEICPSSSNSPNISARLLRQPIQTCPDCNVVCKYTHKCKLLSNQSKKKQVNFVERVSKKRDVVNSVQHSKNAADKEANRKCTRKSKGKSSAELVIGKVLFQNQQSKKMSLLQNTGSTISPMKARPLRIYKCTYCFIQLRTVNELTKHLQTHYYEASRTTCTICQYVYAYQHGLREHLKAKHGIKPRKK